jgi:hypothetical protein
VNIPGDVENVKLKKLERRSHDINDENTIIQELEGKKLTPFEDLGDIFAYSSPKNIRIIVQPPLPATTEPHQGTIEPSCFIDFWSCLFLHNGFFIFFIDYPFHAAIKRTKEEESCIIETWKKRRIMKISTSVPFTNQKGIDHY